MKSIGIVIVSYNSANELTECIESAKASIKQAGLLGKVVVVDNNSSDNSLLVAEKQDVFVISNKQNQGFSKAVNIGLRHLIKDNADYLLILNPDAMLRPSSLTILIAGLESDHKIGATGPAMLDGAGNPANSGYYLKAPSWMSVLLFSTFLRPRFINNHRLVSRFYEETGLDSDREVAQIPGACLLTSREILDNVGLLDEDFAIWYEDVEWCYRARKMGYKMWFCHDSLVEHEGGVSFVKWQNLDKAVTFFVSMKTFFRKHKRASYYLVTLIIIPMNSLLLYAKSHDRSNLVFLKRFLRQKIGKLPS